MKGLKLACLASILVLPVFAQSQPGLFINHIAVNDPRIFDVSSDGAPYMLDDNPFAEVSLNLVHGDRGLVSGMVTIHDNNGQTWGPVGVMGKLSVKGVAPLTLKLKASDKSFGKLSITGSYDTSVQLFRVRVNFNSPSKTKYSWNDSFTPAFASTTGYYFALDQVTITTKKKVPCTYALSTPISSSVITGCKYSMMPDFRFQLKARSNAIGGNWNPISETFSASSCKGSAGYGKIFTAGSLVSIVPIHLP